MIAACLVAMSLAAAPSPQGPAPRVGEPFPLELYPMLGADGLHSLAEFRGNKVLLIQFASW